MVFVNWNRVSARSVAQIQFTGTVILFYAPLKAIKRIKAEAIDCDL